MTRRLAEQLALLALFFSAIGCGAVPRPADGYARAADLLKDLRAEQERISSFRMSGTVDHVGGQRVQGTVYLFGQSPDRLRMDVLSPFGTTLSVLTADGGAFGLSDFQNGRYFSGEANACNVARFTGIYLPPQEVALVLTGGTPMIPGDASLDWNGRGYYEVTISAGALQQTISAGPGPHPVVHRSVLRENGVVVYDIAFDARRMVSEESVPFEIRIRMPKDAGEVFIRYDDDGVELNISLPDDAFVQTVPPSLTVEPLVCESDG